MAATLARLGVYIPDMNINVPAGAAQPVAPAGQANGPANPGQPMSNLPSPGVLPTTGTSVPNANSFPAGLERPGPDVTTANVPFPPKKQPTQGNCPWGWRHQQMGQTESIHDWLLMCRWNVACIISYFTGCNTFHYITVISLFDK